MGFGGNDSILIIGAGVIGSSVAFHLSQKIDGSKIEVFDLDLAGEWSSSELNAGGVRATWNQPINVELSMASIDFFRDHAAEVGYRDSGYLWLCTDSQLTARARQAEIHRKMGWPVEIWDLVKLESKVPFIDKRENLAGATFGPRDGLVNPNLTKIFFRNGAKSKGVRFRDRIWATGFSKKSSLETEVEYVEFSRTLSSSEKREIFELPENPIPAEMENGRHVLRTQAYSHVINCAGPWAGGVARKMGYSRPSRPYRRQISLFESREVDLTPYGMIIDTSGVYFHPEATYGLSGFAVPEEKPGFRYDYDGEAFFQEYIWPPLHERAKCFERLKHVSGWGGLYEVSPDHSAILGKAPDAKNVSQAFEAHSFSGHGVLQSYAAGLVLADCIADGKCTRWDVGQLSGDRFAKNQLVPEGAVI